MPFRRTKIDANSLQLLDQLESWLSGLGMQKYDRIHEAIDVVREHHKKFLALKSQGLPADSNETLGDAPFAVRTFVNANLDVTEFLDIFEAFSDESPDRIVPKLERASSGPFMPVVETKQNSDARNMQFELALAAEWRLNGLNVSIGEPDFTLSVGATNYIIECKRPFREESVRANIRAAKNQLSTRLDSNENLFGAVAISVSRIVAPATHTFIKRSALPSVQRDPVLLQTALLQEARDDSTPLIRRFYKALSRDIQAVMASTRCLKFDFHERVVGMFFHAAPSFILEGGPGRFALSVLTNVGRPGPAYMYLQDSTNTAYNRGMSGAKVRS